MGAVDTYWEHKLDSAGDESLRVRIVYDEFSAKIFRFAVIYLTKTDDGFVEVVRFDASEKELIHAHKFYGAKEEKHRIEKELSFDSIQEIVEEIIIKWPKFKLAFYRE